MLHNLQRDFQTHIFKATPPNLMVAATAAHGSVTRRLGVYRNNTLASLTKALAQTFPVCERIVGEDFFRATARVYVEQSPPAKPELSQYGATFAQFLSGFPPVLNQVPYLADVAALEWARTASFFAVDAPHLSAEHLQSIDAEALDHLQLAPHPATWLVESQYPILTVWEVNQPDVQNVPAVDFEQAEAVLVSRPEHHIQHQAVSKGMLALLDALFEGHTLADSVARAVDAETTFDLQGALAQALMLGVFKAPETLSN